MDRRYVAGLTFHQAKGREWHWVDVVLDGDGQQILRAGLDSAEEDHRKLYVGLTRAGKATRLRST